jgi:hypothetical protein
VAGDVHDLRLTDRDPGDMVDRGWCARCRSARRSDPTDVAQGVSRQATRMGSVRPQTACTTRNRNEASQAHHGFVRRPPIREASAQSYCNHNPGSGTHGRNTRRCPAAAAP